MPPPTRKDLIIGSLEPVDACALQHEDRGCAICQEQMLPRYEYMDSSQRESAAKLMCGHVFGHQCILSWLIEHDSCPTCRMDVVMTVEDWGIARNWHRL